MSAVYHLSAEKRSSTLNIKWLMNKYVDVATYSDICFSILVNAMHVLLKFRAVSISIAIVLSNEEVSMNHLM